MHVERNKEQIDFGENLSRFSSQSISYVENTYGHNMLQFTRVTRLKSSVDEGHEQSKFRVWLAHRGGYWI
jgi:hypothetical protein